MEKLFLTKKEQVKRWDFVQCLKPPASLSIEKGQIALTEKLNQNSHEYEFVSRLFLSTHSGAVNNRLAALGGGLMMGGAGGGNLFNNLVNPYGAYNPVNVYAPAPAKYKSKNYQAGAGQ